MEYGIIKEAEEIYRIITNKFPDLLEGKNCILELKSRGSTNWRQMEWMGFYTEEVLRDILIENIGGSIGPQCGRTTFDYKKDFVWDIKVHSLVGRNGLIKKWAILNDDEAIRDVINDFGIIGFILAKAESKYDLNGEFKNWHDKLKGKTSEYVRNRIARGAPSRLRKTEVKIKEWIMFWFNDENLIETGKREGWLKPFQEGMRNADGSPRRPKIMIDVHNIPKEIIIKIDTIT